MTPITYDEAMCFVNAGISIVPVREDGSKAVDTEWLIWQRQLPTPRKVMAWYRDRRRYGLAAITGPISGNLICLEFDDPATWILYRDTAEGVGLGDVLGRIEAGYRDDSPNGGPHLLFRCDHVGRNAALARRPKRPDEKKDQHDQVKVLIETREGGGGVICAPSNGSVHPTGRPYVRVSGGPASIAAVAPEERADLYELARAFDQMPRVARQERAPLPPRRWFPAWRRLQPARALVGNPRAPRVATCLRPW